MDIINFLLFLFVYIPINIVVMLLAALFFSILNKVLGLNFSTWVVALSAGILVFALLVSMIETSTMKQGSTGLYYTTTFIINIAVIIVMLTFSGIGSLVLKKNADAVFSFGTSQKIAAAAYLVAIGSVVAIPALGKGKDYLQDVNNDKYKSHIKAIIEKNDKPAFETALEKNYQLAELKLDDYTNQSLLEYLLVQNKTALVDVLLKKDKALITYSMDWQINSVEMTQVLIDHGMTPAEVVEKLTVTNNSKLVKAVVEKYHPEFDTGNTSLVQYISSHLLEDNHNMELFDYLIAHGLASGAEQTGEATSYFIKKNDLATAKMLDEKGFKIDTSRHDLMESAISNKNVDLIHFLLDHHFNMNRPADEFTYVEYAIISNSAMAMDALLKLNPDITTLHMVDHEGETNAFLLAEKYKQHVMLEKLKVYSKSS